jgi:hypothetical protein
MRLAYAEPGRCSSREKLPNWATTFCCSGRPPVERRPFPHEKQVGQDELKPAVWIAGNGAGRKSNCDPLAIVIAAKVEAGLSARRVYWGLQNC